MIVSGDEEFKIQPELTDQNLFATNGVAASRLPTLINHTFERSAYYISIHIGTELRGGKFQIFRGVIALIWADNLCKCANLSNNSGW